MKTCPYCHKRFVPVKFAQVNCNEWECALKHVRKRRERVVEAAKRKSDRVVRVSIKRLSEWLAEAQIECNKYVRYRDRDLPCISCGRCDWEIEDKWTGGKWDAGHFRSRGAEPALRFNARLNIHKQCKGCNGGSGKYVKKRHTVHMQYEENLIQRIGQKNVEWLNGPHQAQHLKIPDAQEIKAYYREQLKLLKESNNG